MNQTFIKALHKLKILNHVSVATRRNGTVIPIVNGEGYVNMFGSEEWMKSLLRQLFKEFPGTFIDVGANVGQTLMKVREVSAEVDYVGFEPIPKCVAYLNEFIRTNRFKNCRIIPVGLAEKTALRPLHFYADNDTDAAASIIADFRQSGVVKIEYVPCFAWKDLHIDTGKIGVVKIDVEGAELEVIQCMRSVLEKDRPAVIMEILPDGRLPERIARQVAIQDIFTQLGYDCHLVLKKDDKLISLSPVKEINNYKDMNAAEYVFLPK